MRLGIDFNQRDTMGSSCLMIRDEKSSSSFISILKANYLNREYFVDELLCGYLLRHLTFVCSTGSNNCLKVFQPEQLNARHIVTRNLIINYNDLGSTSQICSLRLCQETGTL